MHNQTRENAMSDLECFRSSSGSSGWGLSTEDLVQFRISRWIGRFNETDRILALFQVMCLWSFESLRANEVASCVKIGPRHLKPTPPSHQSKRLHGSRWLRNNNSEREKNGLVPYPWAMRSMEWWRISRDTIWPVPSVWWFPTFQRKGGTIGWLLRAIGEEKDRNVFLVIFPLTNYEETDLDVMQPALRRNEFVLAKNWPKGTMPFAVEIINEISC